MEKQFSQSIKLERILKGLLGSFIFRLLYALLIQKDDCISYFKTSLKLQNYSLL